MHLDLGSAGLSVRTRNAPHFLMPQRDFKLHQGYSYPM
jgi:hypothetical protein